MANIKMMMRATIDERTTDICLDADGRVRDVDEPFDKVAGAAGGDPSSHDPGGNWGPPTSTRHVPTNIVDGTR